MNANNSGRFVKIILAVAIIAALAIAAMAQSVSHSLNFSRQAKLGDQLIQQGKYTFSYDDKKDGEVIVSKDGKQIAKAAYKLVELPSAPADSAVVFVQGTDGSLKVRRIEVKGSKTALVFN